MDKELRHWEKEKKMIPVMIRMYCRGNHKAKRKEENIKHSGMCKECEELTSYALYRLDKCPFKKNKTFCSTCRVHCYLPEYRKKISAVMRYSGPRMLLTHPIFAMSHAIQALKHKNRMKKENRE